MKLDLEGACLILCIGALFYASCQGQWAVYAECVRRDGVAACKELHP